MSKLSCSPRSKTEQSYLNRRDFIRIHRQCSEHAGIIICKQDHDWERLANNINRCIANNQPLKGKLVRVIRE